MKIIKIITILSIFTFDLIYNMTPSYELSQKLSENGISADRALSILLEEPRDNIPESSTISSGLTLPVSSLLSSDSSQQSSLISSASILDKSPINKKQTDIISLLLNAKKTDEINEDTDNDNLNASRVAKKSRIAKETCLLKPADQIFNTPALTYLIAHGAIIRAEDLALFSGVNKATDKMFRSENLINYLSKMKYCDTYLDIIIQKKLMHLVNKYIEQQKITALQLEIIFMQRSATKHNNFSVIKNLHARNIPYELSNRCLCVAINKGFEDLVLFVLKNQKNSSSFKNQIFLNSLMTSNNPDLLKKILNIMKRRLSLDDFMDILSGKIFESGKDCDYLCLHICVQKKNLEYLQIVMDNCDYYITKDEYGKTILHLACQLNYQPIIDFLLSRLPADQLSKSLEMDDYNRTPLSYAVENNNLDLINILLAKGQKYYQSEFPISLAFALKNKNYKLFETILNNCLAKNLRTGYINMCFNIISNALLVGGKESNENPIFFDLETIKYFNEKYKPDINEKHKDAANPDSVKNFIKNYSTNLPLIQYLIDNGALITDDIFHESLKNSSAEIIELLFEQIGLNIESKDSEDNTILHSIVQNPNILNKRLDLIRKYIKGFKEQGLDIQSKNKSDDTPINCLFSTDWSVVNPDCLEIVTELGYDNLNIQDEEGNTLLHHIQIINFTDDEDEDEKDLIYEKIIKKLIDLGANPNIKNYKGENTLLFIINNIEWEDSNDLNILVENGADINAQDNDGNTTLHYATTLDGDAECAVENIIDLEANTCIENRKKETPLNYLILNNVKTNTIQKVINPLVENGANINAKDLLGNTPLHNYIEYATRIRENGQRIKTIKQLIENKADVTLKNNEGNTPLHLVIGNLGRILEQYTGADGNYEVELDFINLFEPAFEITNHKGQTAYDLALTFVDSPQYLNNLPLRNILLEIIKIIRPKK